MTNEEWFRNWLTDSIFQLGFSHRVHWKGFGQLPGLTQASKTHFTFMCHALILNDLVVSIISRGNMFKCDTENFENE